MELSEQEEAILQAMSRLQKIHLGQLYSALAPGEGHMLCVLACREEGITVSALAEELNMPMPAVSRMMRSMEERELIVRNIAPQDRRSILVTATEKGRRMQGEMCRLFHRFLSELMETLDPEQFRQMIENWNLLMDRMEVLIPQYHALEPADVTDGPFEPGPDVDAGRSLFLQKEDDA